MLMLSRVGPLSQTRLWSGLCASVFPWVSSALAPGSSKLRPGGVNRPSERKPVFPVSLLPSLPNPVHGALGRGSEKGRGEKSE